MSAHAAFTFGAWVALIGGIWFLFDKSESVASHDFKLRITRWLKGLDPPGAVAHWPDTFATLFDHVFGKRHLTAGCFLRSSAASIGAIVVMTAVAAWLHRPGLKTLLLPSELILRMSPSSNYLIVLVATTILSLIPDYISLLETRWMLRRMTRATSRTRLLCLLVADLMATAVIALVPVTLIMCVLRPTMGIELIIRWAATAVAFKGAPGILFYAAFFTSAWLWLYVSAAGVVRTVVRLGVTIGTVRNILDIDKKPLTSLGWVAILLTSIVYWSVALVRLWYGA